MRGRRSVGRLMRALMGRVGLRLLLLLLVGVGMSGLSMLSLFSRSSFVEAASGRVVMASEVSVGDAILWLFLGHPTGLAVNWVALWACVLGLALCDLRGSGPGLGVAPYVQMGGRGLCCAACCLAVAACAVSAVLSLLAEVAILVAALGGQPTLSPAVISPLSLGMIGEGVSANAVLQFVVLLVLGAAALSLLQLALSLYGEPMVAFVLMAITIAASALAPSLPLPGSWLMASRTSQLVAGGATLFSFLPGLVLFGALSALSVLAAARFFSCHDLGIGGSKQ